jgi:NAD(P)-dependent dehydrogenase (short-subunit alcohol dehydrogenase family)
MTSDIHQILKHKVCIVTGAGNMPGPQDIDLVGNGKACALEYARAGAMVLAVDKDLGAARDT